MFHRLRNYTLTGYPNDRRVVAKPTLIFLSKTPTFAPGDLKGLILSQAEVRADQATLIFNFAAGKFKVNNISSFHILRPLLNYAFAS